MGLGFNIGRVLEQYTGATQNRPHQEVERDFDDVSQNAPHEDLQHGLMEAFRSDQTPPFGRMIGQLFGQADTQQRTGMLNQLLDGLGPSSLASILGSGVLGNMLSHSGGDQRPQLTPEQADQLSPQQVEELASRAEQENPGIVDRMSAFYAQNPALVKTLGSAALSIALGKISQRNRS